VVDNPKILRFIQRKQNFDKALGLLLKQSERPGMDDENIAATLHFFEVCFELAWKMLKDYLETQGTVVRSPRETIKTAFAIDCIDDGRLWLEMLDARNNIAHSYDESVAKAIFAEIKKKYVHALKKMGEMKWRNLD